MRRPVSFALTMNFPLNDRPEIGGGRGFPIVLHIDDGVLDDFSYPLKGFVGAFSQPAETRKLDTKSHVFLVILRPADSVCVAITL